MSNISVEEALRGLLSQTPVLPAREFALDLADGLVLGESLVSSSSHPADDMSAMDGYAVVTSDLSSACDTAPVSLPVIEDVRAGFPPTHPVQTGSVSRISTGALVPQGADAVVMREWVEANPDQTVTFSRPPTKGDHIRFAGEHLQVGEEVLSAGSVLGPAEIGMAAFLGHDKLLCFPRPRVAVLATGSELVKAGTKTPLQRGQIHDSNSVALAACLRSLNCELSFRKQVQDSPEELDAALEEAFSKSDVVLTTGGISAGWHDLVRARIEKLGGEFFFHKLKMRPGKPLAFGTCGESNFFCLPGNPVSSFVTFQVFVKPALRKMMGHAQIHPEPVKAVLTEEIKKKKGFTIFFRGILDESSAGSKVKLTGPQGSHILKSLVDANVLIRTEENQEVLEVGTEVEVFPFK